VFAAFFIGDRVGAVLLVRPLFSCVTIDMADAAMLTLSKSAKRRNRYRYAIEKASIKIDRSQLLLRRTDGFMKSMSCDGHDLGDIENRLKSVEAMVQDIHWCMIGQWSQPAHQNGTSMPLFDPDAPEFLPPGLTSAPVDESKAYIQSVESYFACLEETLKAPEFVMELAQVLHTPAGETEPAQAAETEIAEEAKPDEVTDAMEGLSAESTFAEILVPKCSTLVCTAGEEAFLKCNAFLGDEIQGVSTTMKITMLKAWRNGKPPSSPQTLNSFRTWWKQLVKGLGSEELADAALSEAEGIEIT